MVQSSTVPRRISDKQSKYSSDIGYATASTNDELASSFVILNIVLNRVLFMIDAKDKLRHMEAGLTCCILLS